MKKSSEHLGVKIVGGLKETSTAWAGASLLMDLYRQLKMGEAADKVLPTKKSTKGLKHGQMVESFVLLSALGGECIDDMKRLRGDEGLTGMLGYQAPASETARQWLDTFHYEALMARQPLQGSFIPAESAPVVGLKELVRRVVWAYVQNLQPGREVTLDVDAQLIETSKANAKYCYEDCVSTIPTSSVGIKPVISTFSPSSQTVVPMLSMKSRLVAKSGAFSC
jgi:hypothetical protein